ncbi:zinc-binding dehydrogenase [Gordonia sp. NPDC127522]|uniref:zinc-binding dehydrogenase n=1 Tax=Gordonia sp. NPDC127522 TaxID=3345390 RepID=UPI003641BED8
MRAAVVPDTGRLEVATVSLRAIQADEVLVRLDAAAMCITDTLSLDGSGLTPFPLIPGHSATGLVVEAGSGTERVSVGDRVVIVGSVQCRRCYYCSHGSPGACEQIYGGMNREIGVDRDGNTIHADGGVATLAEAMIYRESNVVVVDSSADPRHLAMLGCGIVSGLGAVLDVAQMEPGDSVTVVGCGHLGLWMIQAARLVGAGQIIAVEPIEERRMLAARFGATDLVDPADGDPVEAVRALTEGRGTDVALEAAGRTAAMEQAFAMTRGGGTMVPTGMESPTATVTLHGYEFAIGSKRILSSQTGGGDIIDMIPRFARLMDDGRLDPAAMVTDVYDLDDIATAFEDLRNRKGITGIVRLNAPESGELT